MEDRLREFLLELGTDRVEHSRRTLFVHLKGTHDLLRDWDNEEYVCNAGLFHSIYGTDTFKHVTMTDRDRLRGMIGERAELLVHQFSQGQRPFFKNIEDKDMRKSLLEIEAANLFEQRVDPPTLRRLATMPQISNGARAALTCGAV